MKRVIRKPLISEKNTKHLSSGVYAFEVDRTADKAEIKSAIEKLFQVKVVSVRTLVSRGKTKRTRLGVSVPKHWKKALVKLAPGSKIGIFEGV